MSQKQHKYHPYSPGRKIRCPDTGETVSGDRYLSSEHWKTIRVKAYEYYKGVCQRCRSNVPLETSQIHHRIYKRLGQEKITDLVLYCDSCHACVHKDKKDAHATNRSIYDFIHKLTPDERTEALRVLMEYFGDRHEEFGNSKQ